MAGAALVVLLGNVRYKGALVLLTTAIYGLLCIPLGYSQLFILSLLITAGLGFTDSVGATVRQTTVQLLTPDELRGRVTSVHQAFSMGAPSLGYVQIGIMASLLGPAEALALGGVLCVLTVGLVALWWRGRIGMLAGV